PAATPLRPARSSSSSPAPPPPETYTLSLHDALPIYLGAELDQLVARHRVQLGLGGLRGGVAGGLHRFFRRLGTGSLIRAPHVVSLLVCHAIPSRHARAPCAVTQAAFSGR